MTINVKFVDIVGYISETYTPVPAKNMLPEWYKRLSGYQDLGHTRGEYLFNSMREKADAATIKKCMPVFDTLSAGYIITIPQDLNIRWSEEHGRYYEWSDYEFIKFHNGGQVVGHPIDDGSEMYPKFRNPWSVITPKGYSCLFVQPMHRESPFEILPGIVDTDTYHGAVQFPFTFKEKKWEGLIPAGTPMAQVIPFKRESFTHSVHTSEELGYNPDLKANHNLATKFMNKYRTLFWNRKEYN